MSGTDDARALLDAIGGYTTPPPVGKTTSQGRPVRMATIDTGYVTGMPRVLFDGEALMGARTYPWDSAGGYQPRAGQRVYMVPVGHSYVIGGPVARANTGPRLFDLRPLVDSTKAQSWNDTAPSDGSLYAPAHAWRLASGEVMMHGLFKSINTTATNSLWMTLPPELRPLTKHLFLVVYGGANAVRVQVNPDGTVYVGGSTGYNAGQYIDLSGIHYNNSPTLARTPMVLTSPWVRYDPVDFAPQYVADDGYGRKFWEGIVKSGAPGGSVATVANNPGIMGANGLFHMFLTTEAAGFSRIDLASTPALIRSGSPSTVNPSTQFSLSHSMLTDTAYASGVDVYYSNGGNYGGGWALVKVARLADGAIKLSGLGSATAAGNWFRIPQSMAPKHQLIFVTEGTDNPARIDVSPAGYVQFVAGTGTFLTTEDVEWMPAEAWDRAWPNAA